MIEQPNNVERAIALLREAMESTGSGTLHYQKMSEVIELLTPPKIASSSLDGRILKDSYRTTKNFNLICQCGHRNGLHWYLKWDRRTDKSVTATWDCRDCECSGFKMNKEQDTSVQLIPIAGLTAPDKDQK